MTGTTDKPSERPEVAPTPPAPEKPSDLVPWRLFWPQPKTIRHVVIEVLIVTIGVLLALGIDQLRQHFTRLAQADEARQLLRAEIRGNLESVESGMPRLAEVYRMLGAEPENAPAIYIRGRLGTPTLVVTAYDLAVQNGALSFLGPEERNAITAIYREIEVHSTRTLAYAEAVRQLASYATGTIEDKVEASARARQARLAQVYATAVFRSDCRVVMRFTAALGEPRIGKDPPQYCGTLTPSMDVEAIIAGRYEPPATDAPAQSEAPN